MRTILRVGLVVVSPLFVALAARAARLPLERVDLKVMPRVDVAGLLAEDEVNAGRKDVPLRIAYPMKADISPERAGTWEVLPNGDRTWRVRVRSLGARWLVLGFGTFRLQPGGALWAYDPERGTVLGPFTSADQRDHGQLWLPPLAGDTAVVEIHWPKELGAAIPNIHLGGVTHGYKRFGRIGAATDAPNAPEAGACEIDVNCPLGAAWQDEKRGVVNLFTSGGGGLCTGSLITNTSNDCKNYVLTAAHCLSSQSAASGLIFQFNFERPACNSGTAPSNQTLSGSFLRATFSASDVTLLEMDDAIPDAWNPYYNGWSRTTVPATRATCIHHPNNDEKKISDNVDPLTNGVNWGADHWRVEQWEQAATEPGSSGSPLFDQNSRIVGQLHGGTSSCSSQTYDEYGKVDVSWNGGGAAASRLRDWLDPGPTGALDADGIDYTFCRVPQPRLRYQGHLVDDGAGNGNGVAEPGESFTLRVTSRNEGTLGATAVSGALSSAAPFVTIPGPGSAWPDIPQAEARESASPHFTVSLDAGFECGATVPLHLDLSAGEAPGAWAADFSVATGTASVSTTFEDDLESGVDGWTTQTLEGPSAWASSSSDAQPGHSPTHAWFVNDTVSRSEALLLLAPIAPMPPHAKLTFSHRYNTEANYDGGVLEYATNGGAWQDAAPLITLGAYAGSISSGAESVLAGRAAWAGDSVSWQPVEADLSSLAGQSIQLRWRFASDTSVSDEGWRVDDVVVRSTSYSCAAPLAKPGEAAAPAGPGSPLMVSKDEGGFLIAWSAPPSGGTPAGYALYQTPLQSPATPTCEAELGSGTSTVLPVLADDRGFLVVARNGAGEGSYGTDSGGVPRSEASGPAVCP